ncbi:glycosyltransferase family 4 protein [Candidatus Bathyarchaeota archaeon]|nr:glycosyltransferase family 4 protein [Candidatus Bathyarchaeota archaeon]
MKLLVFGGWQLIDSTTSGGAVRIASILRRLAKLGHMIDYFTLAPSCRDYDLHGINVHEIGYPLLSKVLLRTQLIQRILASLKSHSAVEIFLTLSPLLALKSRPYMKSADVVWLNYSSNLFPLLFAKQQHLPCILDTHGLSQPLIKTSKDDLPPVPYWARFLLLGLVDRIAYSVADRIIVTSQFEKRLCEMLFGVRPDKVEFVENGVDVDEFKPDRQKGVETRRKLGIPENAVVIVFVGYMKHLPNVQAAKYIIECLMPHISFKEPEAWMLLVGEHGRLGIKNLSGKLLLTGRVSDLAAVINAADICIAPLVIGTGIKTKVLTYMACEKVVVSTPIGVEGLGVTDGKEALICSIEEFAEKVVFAIRNITVLSDMGRRARDFVCKYHSWNKIVEKADRMLEAMQTATS